MTALSTHPSMPSSTRMLAFSHLREHSTPVTPVIALANDPCATCDQAVLDGAVPGTVVETVVGPNGIRLLHRAPDPSCNDLFYPGPRSTGFIALEA